MTTTGNKICLTIAIFGNKQWLLSLDMKTKLVQHVPRINLSNFNFWNLILNFQIFKFLLVPSFCLTFRHFLYWSSRIKLHSLTWAILVVWCIIFSAHLLLSTVFTVFCIDLLQKSCKVWHGQFCQTLAKVVLSNSFVDIVNITNSVTEFC